MYIPTATIAKSIYLCTLSDSVQAAVVESAYIYVLYLILYKLLLLNLHIFMYST